MRAELYNDLSVTRRVDQTIRPVNYLIYGLDRRYTGEDHIALRADIGGRLRRNPAELLEIGERTPSVAEHAVAALHEVFADWQTDLANTHHADRRH